MYLIRQLDSGGNDWSKTYYLIHPNSIFSPIVGIYKLRFDNMGTTKIDICNIKIEKADIATPWTPAPEDCTFGTTQGDYLGILTWDKPYPSSDPTDYTWTEIT